jgi:ectoine hydroxylase-related dioxygenase (phytanoyl-CoA dioxygenase family)
MFDEAARKQYEEKGWLVVNDVFNAEEIARIRDLAMQVSHEELKDAAGPYKTDASADGELAPRKIDKPHAKSEEFDRIAHDARLMDLVKELMGVQSEPMLYSDQIFMKPPRFGSAKPYHQDNAYFRRQPSGHVITAWIALDDVDESNGCLRYIDGSHLGEILPHEEIPGEPHNQAPPPELIDLNKESLALVRQGGVVFHHSQTLHTSHRNESDRWRRAYATHWIADDVVGMDDAR